MAMASRCRRAVKCRAKRYRPTFSAPAPPPVRGLPQPLAPEQRSQRIGFSFRTSFKSMRAQVRASRPARADRHSRWVGGLPRHADRDRRTMPFIPALHWPSRIRPLLSDRVRDDPIVTDHGTDAARESQNRNAALVTGVPAYWRGSWLNHARAAFP